MDKPILLHLGDDVKWNFELYDTLKESFDIRRSFRMNRNQFKKALLDKTFGEFAAMYRPHWGSGGEMGNWDAELIDLLPNSCRIFASAGAGFDWVNTKCLAEKNIIYCNSAVACTESVADTAIYMILGTFRRFTQSSLAARSLDPAQFAEVHHNLPSISRNPHGHTLGIIGFGRVGTYTAQKAYLAFGMKIAYYDIIRSSPQLESIAGAVFQPSLEKLLEISDCVVLAAPYTGSILLGKAQFSAMKSGSRFINVARGKMVDEEALVEALKSGHISAAALDVHFDEPNVNSNLANMPNVELHCHTAGGSVDSHMGFEEIGMRNILSYFTMGTPQNAVNLDYFNLKGPEIVKNLWDSASTEYVNP